MPDNQSAKGRGGRGNQAKPNISSGYDLAIRTNAQNQPQSQLPAAGKKEYELLANFFTVDLGKVNSIYQYHIDSIIKVKPATSSLTPPKRPLHPKRAPLARGSKAATAKEKKEKAEQDRLYQEKFHAQHAAQGGQPDDPGHTEPGNEETKLPKRMRRRLIFLLCTHLQANGVSMTIASDYDTCLLTVERIEHKNVPGVCRVPYYDEDEEPRDANLRLYDILIGPANEVNVRAFLDANGNLSPANQNDILPALLNPFFSHCANAYTWRDRTTEPQTTYIGSNKYYLLDWHNQGLDGDIPPWRLKTDRTPNNIGGVEAIPGFFRSIRASIGSNLLLNVNTTTSAFYMPGNLNDNLDRFGRNQSMRAINSFVKGLRVRTTYMQKSFSANKKAVEADGADAVPREHIYTIRGLPFVNDRPTASNVFFEHFPEGKNSPEEITVQAYWRLKDKHRIILQDFDLVIDCGRGGFIPAKWLEVLPGQNFKSKTEMVGKACRLPPENSRMIKRNGMYTFGINVHDPYSPASCFSGLTVNPDMISVPVVKLEPTGLQYSGVSKTKDEIQEGAWNLRGGVKAFLSGPRKKYIVYELYRPRTKPMPIASLHEFQRKFGIALRNFGLSHGAHKGEEGQHRLQLTSSKGSPGDEKVLQTKFSLMKSNGGISLVVLLLPDSDPELYAQVKRAGDLGAGMHTICHVAEGAPSGDMGLLANLTMKVNLKLDRQAANQVLPKPLTDKLLTSKTMIVGIDVTHPAPNSAVGAPSVAAVVSSVDENFAQYPASLRVNPRPAADGGKSMEQVVHLSEMIEERLLDFKAQRKYLPDRLVIYRDGLSEAQFDMCKDQELREITKALNKVSGGPHQAPKILLVCSVKRHHARFFDAGSASKGIIDGKSNPRPGVAVFQKITYGQDKDFFLVSQKTIIGTARPCHYVVLHNELDGITITDVAEATHHLCYLYGRACRSVSVAPPAYYADLAADRARYYVRKWYMPDRDTAYLGDEQAFADALRVHNDMKNSMFYI